MDEEIPLTPDERENLLASPETFKLRADSIVESADSLDDGLQELENLTKEIEWQDQAAITAQLQKSIDELKQTKTPEGLSPEEESKKVQPLIEAPMEGEVIEEWEQRAIAAIQNNPTAETIAYEDAAIDEIKNFATQSIQAQNKPFLPKDTALDMSYALLGPVAKLSAQTLGANNAISNTIEDLKRNTSIASDDVLGATDQTVRAFG